MGTRGSFLGVKRLERESNHSPPPDAEVKNGGAIPPLPSTPLWHGAQLKYRDNFTLILVHYTYTGIHTYQKVKGKVVPVL
jgi:hypothetical protein